MLILMIALCACGFTVAEGSAFAQDATFQGVVKKYHRAKESLLETKDNIQNSEENTERNIDATEKKWETADPATDWKRSDPDIVIYLPKGGDLNDFGNEHFLVFQAPKSDELLATWNQCTKEAFGDNHIVIARSDDDGHTWRQPEVLRYRDNGEPMKHPLAPCPRLRGRVGQ